MSIQTSKALPTIVISFDFELGWGALDTILWKKREILGVYKRLESVIPELITLLSDCGLPTTWGVVGAMIDPTPKFNHLPSAYAEAATFFKRNALESSADARRLFDHWHLIENNSEIASHSYSHIYASYPDVQSQMYIQDIELSITTLRKYFSSEISTLIFPRDQSDYLKDIEGNCQLNTRLNTYFDNANRNALVRIKDTAVTSLNGPKRSLIIEGKYNTIHQTGSFYFNWIGGKYPKLKKQITLRNQNFVQSNLTPGNVYHIWLHPYNLAENNEVFEAFKTFLKNLSKLREAELIDVKTMNQISTSFNIAKNSGDSSVPV